MAPGLAQAGGDGAIPFRCEGVKDAGAGGGADAAGVEQVFQGHRDAVEQPAVASGGDVALGLPRRRQGRLGQQGDKGIERRLGGADARQMGFDDFHRRNFALPNPAAQLGGAHIANFQFVHAKAPVVGILMTV